MAMGGIKPTGPAFAKLLNDWVALLFFIPALAGGVFGLLGIIINLLQDPEISNRVPHWLTSVLRLPWPEKLFSLGPRFWPALAVNEKLTMPTSAQSLLGIFMFALLAASLFYFARKILD